MAQYAQEGDPAHHLMEECAEVIQVIAKLGRFRGNWHEIPPGKNKTRWEMLEEEMKDLLFAWDRLLEQRDNAMEPTANWDGDASHSE